ncbi:MULTISPECIES: DUF559 domain-containing protein [Pelosinus]|uniref:DUF559 domain-containing protein n=1 Tax=Pelosinus TaxID=365348 RepID=UPI001ED983F5|nr:MULTISPECIES: DUF559 domain-containing protein [Pelosinus]
MIDLNSPIEKIMREALIESNIKYREQEAVYKKGNPVPIYIIDFVVIGEYCKIAIECDGNYHTAIDRKRLDAQRDYFLIQQNHYYDDLLRFTGREIKNHISECIKEIITSINQYDILKRMQKKKMQIDIYSMRNKQIDYSQSNEIINIISRETAIVLQKCCNNKKLIQKELRKAIRKNYISINEQQVYFVYPIIESSLFKKEIDFFITAYNSIYLIKLISNGRKTEISNELLKESNIVKVFININLSSPNGEIVEKETKSWVFINGKDNLIIDSDFQTSTLKSDKEINPIIEDKFTVESLDALNDAVECDLNSVRDGMEFSCKTIQELRKFVLEIGNTGREAHLLKMFFVHKDYEVRRLACSAASKIANPEITQYIVPCLYVLKPQIRQYALKAILKSQCKNILHHIPLILEKEEKDYNIILCKQIIKAAQKWKR